MYASINKTKIVWLKRDFFFKTWSRCVSCLCGCLALCCFHSLISTQTFRRAHVSGQLRGDKECPFSGVTTGRVWRKVPEIDPRECVAPLLPKSQKFTQRRRCLAIFACVAGLLFFLFLSKLFPFSWTHQEVLFQTNIATCLWWCWRLTESLAQSKNTRSQKPKLGLIERGHQVDGWLSVLCAQLSPALRNFSRVQFCADCTKGPSEGTVNWGPPCVSSCKKITCAC